MIQSVPSWALAGPLTQLVGERLVVDLRSTSYTGMWRPTGQKGLWFHAGGLAQCRIFSKVLALQIKARELGITS